MKYNNIAICCQMNTAIINAVEDVKNENYIRLAEPTRVTDFPIHPIVEIPQIFHQPITRRERRASERAKKKRGF